GSCKVTYHNEAGKNTYGEGGAKVYRMELYEEGGSSHKVEGFCLDEELARKLREGGISKIDAYLN
ncbi:MAG: hypothetical protein K2J60_06400, partial [Acetatifactor sp.]|nr:hypothetical protein [Acetatifactor sp.]